MTCLYPCMWSCGCSKHQSNRGPQIRTARIFGEDLLHRARRRRATVKLQADYRPPIRRLESLPALVTQPGVYDTGVARGGVDLPLQPLADVAANSESQANVAPVGIDLRCALARQKRLECQARGVEVIGRRVRQASQRCQQPTSIVNDSHSHDVAGGIPKNWRPRWLPQLSSLPLPRSIGS